MNAVAIVALLISPFADATSQLRGLTDPSWHVRERTTGELLAAGRGAYPAMWVGRYAADPEIRARCRRIEATLAQHRRDAALADAHALCPWPADYPFLDSFWFDAANRKYVDNALSPVLQPYISDAARCTEPAFARLYCGHYRQATRDWMRAGIEAGVPLWVYRLAFVELRRRDEVYLHWRGFGEPARLPVGPVMQ